MPSFPVNFNTKVTKRSWMCNSVHKC